jgi:hypothetical protein
MIPSTEMCNLVGCSYRQLDYWTRNRVIVPAVEPSGPGTRRLFAYRQVRTVRLVTDLARLGAQRDVLMRASMLADLIPEDEWIGTLYVDEVGEISATPTGPGWAIDLDACVHGRGGDQRELDLV